MSGEPSDSLEPAPLEPSPLEASPLKAGELAPFLARLDAGEDFKAVLEALLLSIPLERADHLGLLLREGRGAWLPLLRSSGGRALFVGNALSGTVHALAALGFRPWVLEASAERARFEAHRCKALTGVEIGWSLAGGAACLGFPDDAFELVVQEGGAPTLAGQTPVAGAEGRGWGHDWRELRRVSSGEVVVAVDNRLGYKRSLGRRGRFEVPSPWRYAREVLRPPRGERSLPGYRRELAFEGCAPPRAFALYPCSMDFTHVVALDEAAPRLHIGPKERENRLKLVGYRAGLFPWLAPSFALVSSTRELEARVAPRIERALDQLAERSGEARPAADELIASRGNCVVLQTRPPHGERGRDEGWWTLHVALGPHKHAQVERHYRVLEELWERGRPVPVPEPIFFGELEGMLLSCERRLPGHAAPQYSGDAARMRRVLEETASHFAALVEEPPSAIDEAAFDELFEWRFELVAAHAGRRETADAVLRMRDETRELVLGEAMPRALQHADLRNKHVQIDEAGGVLGYLDWGSSRSRDVPYFDLLQLVVHEHKQARGGRVGDSWRRLLLEGGCADWERAALDGYVRRIGLSSRVARALERCFPVFVAAMAESNWDYSRPRWLHASFGI